MTSVLLRQPGIGSDDVFLFLNTWLHSGAKGVIPRRAGTSRLQFLATRLRYTYGHAGAAMFITTVTTVGVGAQCLLLLLMPLCASVPAARRQDSHTTVAWIRSAHRGGVLLLILPLLLPLLVLVLVLVV